MTAVITLTVITILLAAFAALTLWLNHTSRQLRKEADEATNEYIEYLEKNQTESSATINKILDQWTETIHGWQASAAQNTRILKNARALAENNATLISHLQRRKHENQILRNLIAYLVARNPHEYTAELNREYLTAIEAIPTPAPKLLPPT